MRPMLDIRHYLDTRAGTVLTILAALSTIAIAALAGILQPFLVEDTPSSFLLTVFAVTLPLTIALPVLAVTIVAGEWSNSSIQTTFLHRPSRGAVLVSKIIAALIIGLAVIALGLLAAWAATHLGGALSGSGAEFSGLRAELAPAIATVLTPLLFGIVMGALLQSTPLALVASLAVPMVVLIAGGLIGAFGSETVARIFAVLDLSSATIALSTWDLKPEHVASLALLLVLPIVAGTLRWNSREIG